MTVANVSKWYEDYPPMTIYPDDLDIVRRVLIVRYVRIDKDGVQRRGEFHDEGGARLWCKEGDTIDKVERYIYCLVDRENHRRSYWCGSKEQCEDFAVAYAPGTRPDFGHDTYVNA